jgi:hypothetical protein
MLASPRFAFWAPVVWMPIFLFFAFSHAFKDDSRLERDGVETSGRVTGKFPRDHQTVSVSYTVGASTYEQRVSPERPGASYEQIRPGDSMVVTYLPSDPAVVRGGPRPLGTDITPWIGAMIGLIGGFGLGCINAWRIRRDQGLR